MWGPGQNVLLGAPSVAQTGFRFGGGQCRMDKRGGGGGGRGGGVDDALSSSR